jgi:hypothetical protein
LAVLLTAGCTHGVTSDTQGMLSPAGPTHVSRVEVYETLIRHLADADGPRPIYVDSELCFALMPISPRCQGHLSHDEQRALRTRLRDLGPIVFVSDRSDVLATKPSFQAISLSPIVERPDGLRVEGGDSCGSTCGTRRTYVVAATPDGYVVTGTDDTYGIGVA